jgi:DNA (cytosine-5)-methyltransferase 1
MIFIGCSPCQYWSIIKTDKTKSEKTKNLLHDFQRFVDYFKPGFIAIENVPGLFSRSESPLMGFLKWLKENRYESIAFKAVKVLDYGVPQSRKRFVLIASRTKQVEFPHTSKNPNLTVRNFIGDTGLFPAIPAGHRDETDFCHTASALSEISRKRLEMTPIDGGSRSAWQDTEMQLDVYQRKRADKNFGFGDVYGRLSWDRPASTITTKFFGISHGRFAHPEQNRAISIREAATLQTFPLSYVFKARSIESKARLIGNAVPPEMARRIALAILRSHQKLESFGEQQAFAFG